MLRYLIAIPLALLAGMLGYTGALWSVWGQSMGGDALAVVYAICSSFAVALPLVYTPILMATRRALGGYQPLWVFPLVGAMIGVAPTAVVFLRWGGNLRSLFSPEASLFLIAFTLIGAVFGFGFAVSRPRVDPAPALKQQPR